MQRVSWYRITLIVLLFSMLTQAKELMSIPEDELIMRGLLYDEYKAYEDARQVYAKLYAYSDVDMYLFKEASVSLKGKTHVPESIDKLKQFDISNPDRLEVTRLLIPLYIINNQLGLAKVEAENLLEHSKNVMDIELASNPFLYLGEFKRALALLNSAYAINQEEDILLRISDIMDEYTKERLGAIQLLETHRRMNEFSNNILIKLLVLYGKEQDVEGLLEIYEVLYTRTKDTQVYTKILDLLAYKNDGNAAIAFLEKYSLNDRMLYELYKGKKLFKKALTMVERKYKENNNPFWLAEKAMLLFESAEDKKNVTMLNNVVRTFDDAFKLGVDDSVYLNYYGYTLIENNINIEKGIVMVKEALKQQPNNMYYLDSLAWGHYKKQQCSKAYIIMKRVVDEEGLSEIEIKDHWNAIQKCK